MSRVETPIRGASVASLREIRERPTWALSCRTKPLTNCSPRSRARMSRNSRRNALLLVFFLDTCRCHKRLTTNYRLFPPYVNQFPLTHNGNISVENMTGMLPQILNDLIVTCCQTCASHGESFVDFMYNGTDGEAKQESERNMKLLIEDRNDLR